MRAATISLFLCLATSAGAAEMQSSFAATWISVASDPDCAKAEYPDLLLFTCTKSAALWYFTKPNNAAHPGIIARVVVQNPDGSVSIHEDGRSFGTDAQQPAFKAWLASIAALDQKVKDEMARQHGQP